MFPTGFAMTIWIIILGACIVLCALALAVIRAGTSADRAIGCDDEMNDAKAKRH